VSISAQSCGDFTPSEVSVYYAVRAPKVRQHGHEWRGPCPIHSGTGDNFSVNAETGMWYCHSQCGRGGSMFDLEMELTNTDFPPAANEVRRVVGRPALRRVDREPEMKWGLPGWSHGYLGKQIEAVEQKNQWKHTAIYPYFDAEGRISYVKVRFIDKQNDKTFRQFGLTSKLGWMSRKRAGKTPMLYRLNTLAAATEIFIVNGEKAADRGATDLGIATTCTPDGEGKWWGEYTKALIGKAVRIVIDRDEKGELHGKVVSEALAPHVAEVKIIRLPGLPPKGDLWDWLEAGGTRKQLEEIIAKTPMVEPPLPTTDAPAPQPENHPRPHDTAETGQSSPRLWSFPYSDSGNAERIVTRHGQDVRYCHPQKTWYLYDGARWCSDRGGRMMHIAKCIARTLYEEAAEIGDDDERKACAQFARKCESTERKKAALVSTQSEPGIPVAPEQFDADPFLLNCVNGTVDLRTGELRPHRRADLMTRLCPVQYDPAARSPLWDRFMEEATGGNREVGQFLQRAVGYSLTGATAEEVLFFVHGPGGSGKSTFLEAIKAVLGEYGKSADFETFITRRDAGAIRNDVAELTGRRFVVSIEVDEGKKLAEGLVKLLTGGDTVRARFLYQEAFDYVPQFKLWLAANHAPKVRHDDSAMWRRILRIPFDQVIPKEKRDPSLKARLKDVHESGPAILAWAVEGCLRWQEERLQVPEVVSDATEQYRLDMDPLKDFVSDCCVLHPAAWAPAAQLRQAYEEYCKQSGQKRLLSPREFADGLRSRGCTRDRRHAGHGWLGVGLRIEEPEGVTP
jgi:putative DNA primase/helicase